MERKTSIKARILRLSILSVLVVVAALLTVIAILLNTAYTERYQSEAHHLVVAYSKLIETNIENLYNDLNTVSSDAKVVDESLSLEDRIARLKELAANSRFKDFAISYGDGKTYNNTDISKREYFQHAMKGEFYVSSPVIRMTDNSVTTMMAGPVFTSNGTQYVAYGGLDTMYFSQGFETVSLGEGSSVMVIDKYGQIVASSVTDDVMSLANYLESESEQLQTLAGELIANDEGFTYYTNNGIRFLAAYQNIPDTDGWTICVSANFDDISKAITKDLIICICVCLALTCLGIFISIKVADKIVNPLKNVNDRLKLLSDGDVTTIFNNNAPNDETRILSESTLNTVRTLRSYIKDIHYVLGALAEGDLTVKSRVDYNGDFVEIGDSLETITAALSDAFRNVKRSVGNIRTGAGTVAESAQSLSNTAIEEAQAVSEISETIEKINKQADETAVIFSDTSALTRRANENAKSGGELMKELLAAVENIKEKSYAISEIIKTISDIAFQTNILALNASIEAARAGDAGKGFAVVADEVRNLAVKSDEASKNTQELINDSIAAVDKGTSLASKANEEMNGIVSDIEQVTKEIERIRAAAVEQKESINLINSNISKIETGMSTTTATAEQNAASGEELTSLSSNLAVTVDKYKTE